MNTYRKDSEDMKHRARKPTRRRLRSIVAAGTAALGLLTGGVVATSPAGATVYSDSYGSASVGAVWCQERTSLAIQATGEGINIPVTINPEAQSNWTNKGIGSTSTTSLDVLLSTSGSQQVAWYPMLYNVNTGRWIEPGWRYAWISSSTTFLTPAYRPPNGVPAATYQVYVYFSWQRPTGWTKPIGEAATSYSTRRFNSYLYSSPSETRCTV